jgi:hypothetical protein
MRQRCPQCSRGTRYAAEGLLGHTEKQDGRLTAVRIAGRAVTVMHGVLSLPP